MATKEKSEKEIKRDILLEFGAKPGITIEQRDVGVFRHLKSETKIKIGTKGEADIQGRITRLIPVPVENNNSAFQPVTLQMKVKIAQPLAIEVKTPEAKKALLSRIQRQKLTQHDIDQLRWRDAFVNDGGLYILASSIEDVYAGIEAPLQKIR